MPDFPTVPAPSSRREAELEAENEALRRALQLYHGTQRTQSDSPLWAASPDLLGVTDADGVWLEVNPAWTRVLGWPPERILGRSSDWLLHPDDAAAYAVQRRHPMRDDAGGHFEYRCRTAGDGSGNGDYRLISWTRIPAGDRFHHVGRDITDERARETALRDSLDFARLALAAVSGVGVWTYDAASDRFFCDAGISELYGIDPDQGAAGILRADFLANVHPDDLAPLRATMAGGLRRSGDLELEYRICHPDGSTRWVLSRGHTYFDDAGIPLRRTGVGIETTRQRQLEQQLRQSQKMEAVGQLTGGIAHDFNNMLQGVMGPLDMLRLRLGRASKAALSEAAILQHVDMAMASARRAATLTHRLLAFSRRQPLAPQQLDVNVLVQGLAELLRRTIGEKIRLALAFGAADCRTRCDANQLENAVLNLAINARDAMPDGGVLTIRTRVADVGSELAGQHGVQAGPFVCLEVDDNGVGMAPAVLQQACEPFFTTKPSGQGTGLGLSMVYGFAGQSGGFVTIDSSVGRGTVVGIHLPASDAPVDVAAPVRQPSGAPDGAGAALLVVEDDPTVRAMLCDLFGEAGYRVRSAANGFEAQAGIEADARIDLLVTDIGLPGMNGRQLAEAARRLVPDLPVLLMTGYAELAAAASGFMAPGMALIAKPFDIGTMLHRVRTMLDSTERAPAA
jgi:PAS domain S-box-containing protein